MADEGGIAGWQARVQELEGQLASVRAEVRVLVRLVQGSSALADEKLNI